jgi:hypothetical protein
VVWCGVVWCGVVWCGVVWVFLWCAQGSAACALQACGGPRPEPVLLYCSLSPPNPSGAA